MSTVGTTVGKRVVGEQASRFNALLASAIVGGAAAAVTYRFLRHAPNAGE
jgi:hypothetical protein